MEGPMAKMDGIKSKFMDLLHKQTNRNMKIPAMGFSDYFVQSVTTETAMVDKAQLAKGHYTEDVEEYTDETQKSDNEIIESIEKIYFDEDSDPHMHELQKVLQNGVHIHIIEDTMIQLRLQYKIISKRVLQNILDQRSACNEQFTSINEIQKKLEESLWTCQKVRSYLNYAKTNLTTTSLEILASYRKREILMELLQSLHAIKDLRSTDVEVQKLLMECNYSGAISLLLKCKDSSAKYMMYNCVQSLTKKLEETLLLTEYQLDSVLGEMVLDFDVRKYSNLKEAYKLLNKSLLAMDQLHFNIISSIHSSVNSVLHSYVDVNVDEYHKYLYEQLCELVTADKYIPCLINLCKTFWNILAAYYQIVMWHQNYKLYPADVNDNTDAYIQEKLKKSHSRIWSDIQSKLCVYLQSSKLKTLKYEQFIQVLSVVQRLRKIGLEFCGEHSDKLIATMKTQSEEFFYQYHICSLEEICLFLDNESWTIVDSFTNILQLQEFRSVRFTLKRHKSSPRGLMAPSVNDSPMNNNHCDEIVSVNSQDGAGSSIYGSCGYFLRFSEKSSPFDGGLDAAMLEEDILSGIVDEASCYYSEESDEEHAEKSIQCRLDEEATPCGDMQQIIANSTSLNVLRCIGRYLQMCKLLHCISPKIVASMLELVDFYAYAVHEIFAIDAPVSLERLYTVEIEQKFENVAKKIVPNVKIWPLNFTSLTHNELANPDTLYGLEQRIVAVASGHCMVQQLKTLQNYLNHLLPIAERPMLAAYFNYEDYMSDVARPVYTCVTSRIIDLPAILAQMSKVKWDINHVSLKHNSYIEIMNRNVSEFAMRLQDIGKVVAIPFDQMWNSMAHMATHLLVEGFSNVKKCSVGGRALMQLDFTNFMSFLELISNQKFTMHRAYVDAYIKAYYISMDQFGEWIEAQNHHGRYSTKQLASLINCVCISDKRSRQKLLNLLDSGNNSNESTLT